MNSFSKKKLIDLVILAGGKGTRLGKITKKIPKPIIKINEKPFLEHLIMHVSNFSFRKIYIMAGYKGHKISKLYNKKIINNIKIECIIEKKPLGTGGCLSLLKKKIKNDFFVINGDTYFPINYKKLIFKKIKNDEALLALTNSENYQSNKKLTNIDCKNYASYNKKSKYFNAGVYYFKRNFLKTIKKEKLSLENIIDNMIKNKKVFCKKFQKIFIDIGTISNLKRSKSILK